MSDVRLCWLWFYVWVVGFGGTRGTPRTCAKRYELNGGSVVIRVGYPGHTHPNYLSASTHFSRLTADSAWVPPSPFLADYSTFVREFQIHIGMQVEKSGYIIVV